MAAPAWPMAMITAHRPQHLADPGMLEWVAGELLRVARKLAADHGTRTLISGLALGGDQIWGWCAIRTELDLAAHIPFPQQPDPWRDPVLTERWGHLRGYAECTGGVTVYGDLAGLSGVERKRAAVRLLHARNDGMLAETTKAFGVVVAVLRPGKLDGGTRSAYDKALKAGLPVIHVNPDAQATTWPEIRTTTEYEQERLL